MGFVNRPPQDMVKRDRPWRRPIFSITEICAMSAGLSDMKALEPNPKSVAKILLWHYWMQGSTEKGR